LSPTTGPLDRRHREDPLITVRRPAVRRGWAAGCSPPSAANQTNNLLPWTLLRCRAISRHAAAFGYGARCSSPGMPGRCPTWTRARFSGGL